MPKGLIVAIVIFVSIVLIISRREEILDFYRSQGEADPAPQTSSKPSDVHHEAGGPAPTSPHAASIALDAPSRLPTSPVRYGACDLGEGLFTLIGEHSTRSAKIRDFWDRCIGDLHPHVQPMSADMRARFALDYDMALSFHEVGITIYIFEDTVVRLGFHSGVSPSHGGASSSQPAFAHSRFSGTLPLGLDFSDNRAEVERKLGEGRRDEWGRHGLPCKSIWDEKGIEVRYQFEDHRRADNEVLSIAVFNPVTG